MKFFQIFSKTPNYKKFNYTPRFYSPEEEEKHERVTRIERELKREQQVQDSSNAGGQESEYGYRQRMRGSFRAARGEAPVSQGGSTSPMFMRFAILLVLTLGLIGYLQYGKAVLYAVAILVVAIFLYYKLRTSARHTR